MRNQLTISFVAGLIFAIGLGLSGMTLPQNILGFLDVRHWNPTLIFVMAGAVTVYAAGMRLSLRRGKPIFGPTFDIPAGGTITWQLVTGAVIFGVGWGMSGYCNGPALASLAAGRLEVIVFVVAMFAGMFVCRKLAGQ